MNHDAARNLLKIDNKASQAEIEAAWQARQEVILGQLRQARDSVSANFVVTNNLPSPRIILRVRFYVSQIFDHDLQNYCYHLHERGRIRALTRVQQ